MILLRKAFVRASTYTNAQGVQVNRKAHFTKRPPAKAKERHLRRTFTDHSDATAKKAHEVLDRQIATHQSNINKAKEHLHTMSVSQKGNSGLSLQSKISHLTQDIKNQQTHIESLNRKKEMINDRGAIWKDQLYAKRAKSKVAASIGKSDHSEGQKKTLKAINNHFISGKTKLQPGGIKVGKDHILVDTKHKDTGETKQIAIHKDGTIHDPKTINFQPVEPKKPVTVHGIQTNKAEVPIFPTFSKANEWLANQISKYGPKFLESDEYNAVYPQIDKLYEQSLKPKKKVIVKAKTNTAKPVEAKEKTENKATEMKAGDFQKGEKLSYSRTSPATGKLKTMTGTYVGGDHVKLDTPLHGVSEIKISEFWKRSGVKEPEKTEAQKTEDRSKSMLGNKNAWKGGPNDEPNEQKKQVEYKDYNGNPTHKDLEVERFSSLKMNYLERAIVQALPGKKYSSGVRSIRENAEYIKNNLINFKVEDGVLKTSWKEGLKLTPEEVDSALKGLKIGENLKVDPFKEKLNRSQAMMGNKNAYKGGPKEEAKKVVAKELEEPKTDKSNLPGGLTKEEFKAKVKKIEDENGNLRLKVGNKYVNFGSSGYYLGQINNAIKPHKNILTDGMLDTIYTSMLKRFQKEKAADEAYEKSDQEKTENRSQGMMGNKNAWKGGPRDEAKKVVVKKIELPEPKAKKAEKEQPKESSQYSYQLGKHTKTGAELHLVKIAGTLENFRDEKARAGKLGGWYDRYSKAFRFKTEEGAKLFIGVSSKQEVARPKAVLKTQTPKVEKQWKPISKEEIDSKYKFGSKQKEVGRRAKEIAKVIRNDIKQGIKDGILPEGLKVSTTIDGGSYTSSINLSIKELPDNIGIINPYHVAYTEQFPHSQIPGKGHPANERYTKETKSIIGILEGITNQYNYDKSDYQTDYHDRNFYESVGVDWKLKDEDREKVLAELKQGKHKEVIFHDEYGHTDNRPESIEKAKKNREKFEKLAKEREEEGKKTVVVKTKDPVEPEKSELEKHKNRSDALKGNKNAWKGGPKDDPSKPKTVDEQVDYFSNILGLDREKLSELVSGQRNDKNLDEWGKFTALRESIDRAKAKAFIENLEGKDVPVFKVNMRVSNFLRDFIINKKFLNSEPDKAEKSNVIPFKKKETDKVISDLKGHIEKAEAKQTPKNDDTVQMTMDEWKKKHSDFKSIINGQRFVLKNLGGRGTGLVPVDIVKNKTQKTEEPAKTEAEKQQTRSDSMKGNRNAWKGGPKDEPVNMSKSIADIKFQPIGSWTGEKSTPIGPKKRAQINSEVAEMVKKSPASYNASDIAKMRKYSGFGGVDVRGERGVKYDYFTSPPVARMTIQMLNKIGEVKPDSSILEPSVGTGVFFDVLPDTHKKTGVELDTRTAAVAGAIHQDAIIHSGSFEEFNLFNENKFDHVVGNAPFGDRSVATSFLDMPDEKNLDKYFVERSMDNLKPEGTMSLIVAPGVMDGKKGEEWRLNLLKKGKFLGAVRLPNKSFSHTHTGVSPDILFFKKHDESTLERMKQVDKDFHMKEVGAYHEGWVKGSYYKDKPEHKLGKDAIGNFGASIVEGDLSHSAMDEAVKNFTPEDYEIDHKKLSQGTWNTPKAFVKEKFQALSEGEAKALKNKTLNVGQTKTINGVTYFLNANHRWERMDGGDPETTKKLNDIKEISTGVKAIREAMQTDRPVDMLQAHTRQLIQDYIDKHGVYPSEDKDIKKLLKANSSVKDIHEALSTQLDADILTKQNVYNKEIELKNGHNPAIEAMREMAKRMKSADEETVRSYFPNQADELLEEMNKHKDIFLDEKGIFHLREYYLSGNAYEKMDALKKAISSEKDEKKKSKMQQSHDEVKKAIGWKSIEEASFKAYNRWVPEDIVKSWIKKETLRENTYGGYKSYEKYSEPILDKYGKWTVEGEGYGDREIERYLNVVKQRGNTDTKEYNEKMDAKFQDYIKDSPEVRDRVEELYNRNFNSELGSPKKTYAVKIDGWNEEYPLGAHQWQTIHHLYEQRKGISALGTGFGKTFAAIGLASLLRQEGKLKRGFFQVPDNKVMDWVEEFGKAMPGLKIGYLDPESPENKNASKRFTHLQGLANGDYDMIVLSNTTASTIQLRPENEEAINDRISSQMTSKKTKGKSASQAESIKMTAESKLDNTGKKDNTINFEDFGCDTLFSDEMHHHKNLFSSSQSRSLGVTGVSSKDSKRAMSFFKKTEHIRGENDGKNVYGLTATPMSNSPLEFYNMLSHIAPEYLRSIGMTNIDDFIKEYGDIQDDFIYNWANGERKAAKVLKGFHRLDSLRDTFFKFTDYQTDASKIEGLAKPTSTLKPSVLTVDSSQSAAMKLLKDKIEHYAGATSDERKEQHPGENHLTYYMKMRAASLDLELLDPQKYKGWKNPKIEAAATNAFESYKNTGGGQVVFCDRVQSSDNSFNMHDKIKNEFIAKGFKPEEIVIINGMTKGGGKTSDAKLAGQVSDAIKGYNSGKFKVIIGTTSTLGEGVNLQTNSSALHHIDIPFKPSDIQQRNGRIDRQGNKQGSVVLHNYLSAGTIDNYSVGLVQNKANWIDKLLNSKSSVFLNGDDDNFFDTEGLMLSLTEELGGKDEADKMREKIKVNKQERVKKDNLDKADRLFSQYANIKESIEKHTGRQDDFGYQARIRKAGELEESMMKNPEFKYPHLLEKGSSYHYDKKSKEVFEKGDILTMKNDSGYRTPTINHYNVTSTEGGKLKATKIAGGNKEAESFTLKNGEFEKEGGGYFWAGKISKTEGKYSESKASELNAMHHPEEFYKQSGDFKKKNIIKHLDTTMNDTPIFYKDKNGKTKMTGGNYDKPNLETLKEAKEILIPGVHDDEIEKAMKMDEHKEKFSKAYEGGGFSGGVKEFYGDKIANVVKESQRKDFEKQHGSFFDKHVGNKAVPVKELGKLLYADDDKKSDMQKGYDLERLVENSGGKYKVEGRFGNEMVSLAKSFSKSKQILIRF